MRPPRPARPYPLAPRPAPQPPPSRQLPRLSQPRPKPPPLKIVYEPLSTANKLATLALVLAILAGLWLWSAGSSQREWDSILKISHTVSGPR